MEKIEKEKQINTKMKKLNEIKIRKKQIVHQRKRKNDKVYINYNAHRHRIKLQHNLTIRIHRLHDNNAYSDEKKPNGAGSK